MFLGLLITMSGGVILGNFMSPVQTIESWDYEHFWTMLMFSLPFLGLIAISLILGEDLYAVIRESEAKVWYIGVPLTAYWALGGYFFGQAIKLIGNGLTFTLSLGIGAATSGVIPFLIFDADKAGELYGICLFVGAVITMLGVSICGWAGHRQEIEMKLASGLKSFDPRLEDLRTPTPKKGHFDFDHAVETTIEMKGAGDTTTTVAIKDADEDEAGAKKTDTLKVPMQTAKRMSRMSHHSSGYDPVKARRASIAALSYINVKDDGSLPPALGEGENFLKGFALAFAAALGNPALTIAMINGSSTNDIAADKGIADVFQGMPFLSIAIIVFGIGGGIPSLIDLVRTEKLKTFWEADDLFYNYSMSVLSGLLWTVGFLMFGVGSTLMGELGPAIGFPIFLCTMIMASNATAYFINREFDNATIGTLRILLVGNIIILASVFISAAGSF